jgi:GNAT superfamily N-acetyltransferase
MAITIRHAEPADYGPIIQVVDAWWGGRRMADMLPRLFFVHFRPTSFVAEAGGRVVGFLAGFRSQTHPEQAYVHFIGVDPASRASGVGRALYERFFEAARAFGCVEVHGVTSPFNRTSIAFHAAMGFDVLGGDAESGGVPYTAGYDGPGSRATLFGAFEDGSGVEAALTLVSSRRESSRP